MLTPQKQSDLLKQISILTHARHKTGDQITRERHLMLVGVMLALGHDHIPAHWNKAIAQGNVRPLFDEPAERRDYDVLGLKPNIPPR